MREAMMSLAERRGPVLCLILALGFTLRAIQTHLGLPYVYNFDDPQIAAHALAMMKTGDFNPHFFAYGSFLIYLDMIVDAANYLRLAGLPLGTPESMNSYDQINYINRIITPMDTVPGWYWAVSHPSFYLWDRYVTAIFGTLTIATTYGLSRRVISGLMALLPPLLLAILPIHIVQSGLTTADIPVAFMVTAATLGALIFAETGGLTAFLTSLVFVGLAGATKYNSGLILISPLVAVMLRLGEKHRPVRWWHWALSITVPALIFLAAMPFALLDFKTFLTDLATSVSSYHAPGPLQSKPGLRHLKLILSQFEDNIGFAGALVGLIGLALLTAAGLSRKYLLILIVFPVVFILYMALTTTDYHRNFMQIYPFLCIYAGYGIVRISTLRIGAKIHVSAPVTGVAVALLLAVIAIVPLLYRSVANAAGVVQAHDTRTQLIATANALQGIGEFEITDELHIHPFDLDRLNRPRTEVNRPQILQDVCAATSAENRAFILPSAVRYVNVLPPTPEDTASIAHTNELLRSLRDRPGTISIGGDTPTPVWGPPVNPGMIIVPSRRGLCETAATESGPTQAR